ncbi:serine/threonine-protein kinase [Parafrankia elaeagni]|uniref:serine/threonine-protein kinase n=1 Tax=Parafrankia elaeagni TaxID=222534 RepID=UPI00039A8D1A|nr:serine/threonine-protein kinase [Parafrankia elaeagni]
MTGEHDLIAAALPGYAVHGEIGHGSFGVVLSGRDRLNRQVAIKIVPGVDGGSVDARAEALTLTKVDHPHIVRVYDYIQLDDRALIIMELVGGGTLRARAVRGLSPAQVCAVGLATAAALGHAHSRGVLHRDVKPANVLFTEGGQLKVADFGIAREYTGSDLRTATAVGTPRYMAPEQFLAGPLGPSTDLYALGVILYELLAGRPPFRAAPTGAQSSSEGLRRSHLGEAPPPLHTAPAPIGAVVLRALAKRPADRYQTARDFAAALAGAATEALGPDWLRRAGLVVGLDDDIRALATSDPAAVPLPGGGLPAARGSTGLTVPAPGPPKPAVTLVVPPTRRRPEPPAPPPTPSPPQPPRPMLGPGPGPVLRMSLPPGGPVPGVSGSGVSGSGVVAGTAALQRVVGEESRVVIRTGTDAEYRRLGYRTAVAALVLLTAVGLLVATALLLRG